MKIYKTINNDEIKILRLKSQEVKKDEIKKYIKLIKEMENIIKDPKSNWIWLAAPQVWINKRIICVYLLKNDNEIKKNGNIIFMINPKIIIHSKECNIKEEWCLSVPNIYGTVSRFSKIKVSFLDQKWQENMLELSNINARVTQHEIDHLDWILFTDKIINIT